jgi:DNA-binding transcriptional LysR family regulator
MSPWLGAEQRWTVASLYTASKMVMSGLGFAWLPTQEVNAHLQSGALCELPLQQGGRRSHHLFLYANKDRPLGPASQILAELLVEHSMKDTAKGFSGSEAAD